MCVCMCEACASVCACVFIHLYMFMHICICVQYVCVYVSPPYFSIVVTFLSQMTRKIMKLCIDKLFLKSPVENRYLMERKTVIRKRLCCVSNWCIEPGKGYAVLCTTFS